MLSCVVCSSPGIDQGKRRRLLRPPNAISRPSFLPSSVVWSRCMSVGRAMKLLQSILSKHVWLPLAFLQWLRKKHCAKCSLPIPRFHCHILQGQSQEAEMLRLRPERPPAFPWPDSSQAGTMGHYSFFGVEEERGEIENFYNCTQ